MKYIKIILVFTIAILLTNCGSHRKATTSKAPSPRQITKTNQSLKVVNVKKIEAADVVLNDLRRRKPNLNKTTYAYIEKYNDIAILEMLSYSIPASITLAQGILESQNGISRLSTRANNHFGIKCHKSWTGKRIYHDDDARQECFRKYEHAFSSFRDHSLFLYGRDRYAGLFKLRKKDYKGWAKGLRKAGYATDPRYPKKLIKIIEDYELYKYDEFDKEYKYNGKVIKKHNDAKYKDSYVIVAKGDTLYSIAKSNNSTVEKLKWANGLKSNELTIGQKIYIK